MIAQTPVINCTSPFNISTYYFGLFGLVVCCIGLIYFIYLLKKHQSFHTFPIIIGVLLTLFGGFYNSYHRFATGCVLDPLHLGEVYFNIFDVSVLIGLVIIFCYTFFNYGR